MGGFFVATIDTVHLPGIEGLDDVGSERLAANGLTGPLTIVWSSSDQGLAIWGPVLGTDSRVVRQRQGSSREGCARQAKWRSYRENAVASAVPLCPSRTRILHGKEGVDGSSPSEGFSSSKTDRKWAVFLLPQSTPCTYPE